LAHQSFQFFAVDRTAQSDARCDFRSRAVVVHARMSRKNATGARVNVFNREIESARTLL
jgi:hypothetical protein